ncbi:LamG-like jellyroll fold domain-containing protein [Burkholderia alba]|uniref:LamG-like jellyroll fold domain-containing protein n=1 Tax=Burkholderia alba TaxID=2683677 RepID=UPI002B05BD11|nr:LamG-like jellyroll fold domain-containing protein [Burkholderia alba]
MAWIRRIRHAGCIALTALAAACNGGPDSAPVAKPANPANPGNPADPTPPRAKVLLVGVDGATYTQLQTALLQRALPNLATLSIMPSATGGATGTSTEQAPVDAPSWATVLTGAWRNRHGVTDDGSAGALKAPSLFQAMRAGGGTRQLGAVTSTAVLAAMLKPELRRGNLDTQIDCAMAEDCVTQNAAKLIGSGYDLVFAQYASPGTAAAAEGFRNGGYAAALKRIDAALGTLLGGIAARRASNPRESWLVLVTTGHGLDATGSATPIASIENRTAFIALNTPTNALAPLAAPVPVTEAALSALPSEADVAPTVLAYAGLAPDPASTRFAGAPLIGDAIGARGIGSTVSRYRDTLELNWTNPTPSSAPITLWRDGKPLATLEPGATRYIDGNFGVANGPQSFDYLLMRNGVPLSYQAQIDYVAPIALATTLRDGLALYYSVDALPPQDAKGQSTLGPWSVSPDGGSASDDNFAGRALKVDSRIDSYQLTQTGQDIAQSPQFTLGFWFRSDCTQGNGTGEPILSNKNYTSGANAGIAIGLFGSCEVRFNLGSGGRRDDINGMKFSPNQWVYLALSVDTQAKLFSAYILDPVLGVQKTENRAIASTDVTKLAGLGTRVWGINDDATHNYYGNNPDALRGAMELNDLAMWTRRLSLAELTSINASRQPLSSLNP